MKTNLKALFIIALLALSVFTVHADPPTTGPGALKGGELLPPKRPGGRSAIEVNEVIASYNGQNLTITFAEPEGMTSVRLSDITGTLFYSAYHTSAAPIVIPMSEDAMPMFIQLSTSEGNEYEGWME